MLGSSPKFSTNGPDFLLFCPQWQETLILLICIILISPRGFLGVCNSWLTSPGIDWHTSLPLSKCHYFISSNKLLWYTSNWVWPPRYLDIWLRSAARRVCPTVSERLNFSVLYFPSKKAPSSSEILKHSPRAATKPNEASLYISIMLT